MALEGSHLEVAAAERGCGAAAAARPAKEICRPRGAKGLLGAPRVPGGSPGVTCAVTEGQINKLTN